VYVLEWGDIFIYYITLALVVGEWFASRPGHLTTKERVFGTSCIEGWVGSSADVDVLPLSGIEPPFLRHPASNLVTVTTELFCLLCVNVM
jgi:hypothetical protein